MAGWESGGAHRLAFSEEIFVERPLLAQLLDLLPAHSGKANSGSRFGRSSAGEPSVGPWTASYCSEKLSAYGKIRKRYEVQLAPTRPATPGCSQTWGCFSRVATPMLLPTSGPALKSQATPSAPAGRYFPEMRRAGLRVQDPKEDDVKEKERPRGKPTRDYNVNAALWWEMQARSRAGSPVPFRAGQLRPRLLERSPGGGPPLPASLVEDREPGRPHSPTKQQPSRPGSSASNAPGSPGGVDIRSCPPGPTSAREALVAAAAQRTRNVAQRVRVVTGELHSAPEPGSAADGGRARTSATPPRRMLTSRKTVFELGPKSHGKDGSEGRPARRERKFENSVLWKVKLTDDKQSRMDRLTTSRKSRVAYEPQSYRDRVSRRQDVELALESFCRYFPQKAGNPFDAALIIEALADFGIKGRNKSEKMQMKELLAQHEDRQTIGFGDFCAIAEEARGRMRQAHSFAVFQAWKNLDRDDNGALQPEQLMMLLEDLNLAPPVGSPKRDDIEAQIDELPVDEFGMVSLYEAEYLIAAIRQQEQAARRRAEREIQVEYCLPDPVFKEVRSQLLDLYEDFHRLDEDRSGHLDQGEVMNLLSEFGCVSPDGNGREIIKYILEEELGGQDVIFPLFLEVIRRLRELDMETKREEVEALFNEFDTDRSGELDTKEVCAVLVALGLQPRSVLEQDGIAQLMEEVDRDGSGQLNEEELLMMVQRIGEKLAQIQRHVENNKATSLGFSKRTTAALRQAFEALDTGGNAVLGYAEVERAVMLMGWRVPPKRLQRLVEEADVDASGQLDFIEFLQFMRRVDDEVKALRKQAGEDEKGNGAAVADAVGGAEGHTADIRGSYNSGGTAGGGGGRSTSPTSDVALNGDTLTRRAARHATQEKGALALDSTTGTHSSTLRPGVRR